MLHWQRLTKVGLCGAKNNPKSTVQKKKVWYILFYYKAEMCGLQHHMASWNFNSCFCLECEFQHSCSHPSGVTGNIAISIIGGLRAEAVGQYMDIQVWSTNTAKALSSHVSILFTVVFHEGNSDIIFHYTSF